MTCNQRSSKSCSLGEASGIETALYMQTVRTMTHILFFLFERRPTFRAADSKHRPQNSVLHSKNGPHYPVINSHLPASEAVIALKTNRLVHTAKALPEKFSMNGPQCELSLCRRTTHSHSPALEVRPIYSRSLAHEKILSIRLTTHKLSKNGPQIFRQAIGG